VAGWILRKEEGPLEEGEKPRDDPQSEAFVEAHLCDGKSAGRVWDRGRLEGVEKKVETRFGVRGERDKPEGRGGFQRKLEDEQVRERSWSIRTANGSKTRVQWCVELTVRIGNSKRKGVRFYVVEGVPVVLVLGNSSMVR
jgi:hypothetical protein